MSATTNPSELRAAGQILRRPDGRPERLSKRSIQIMLRVLAQIHDEAVEDGRLSANHVRSKRMRVREPKPIRTWRQPTNSATCSPQSPLWPPAVIRREPHGSWNCGTGEPLPQIAERIGLSVPTAYYHLATGGRILSGRGGGAF